METRENGRTHEPSLRELTAELDGLRELLFAKHEAIKELLTERDRLYNERDGARKTAVDAAVTAVREQTGAAFAASEKAKEKSEQAQTSYNQTHNELSHKLDEQNKNTIPRPESESRFGAQEEKIAGLRELIGSGAIAAMKEIANVRDGLMKEIAGLRESRSEGQGKHEGISASWATLLAIVALVASLFAIYAHSGAGAPPAAAPQVIYVPAPAGAMLPATPPQPVPR